MLHICLDDSPRFKWIEMQEVSSTNDFLRRYRATTPLTLVTAEHQTAGRGQQGNTWESREGENLLCSFMFMPTGVRADECFTINQAVALAVRDACQEFVAEEVTVKWPNDIYIGDRKLAGILIETEMSGTAITRVIAGIGINVNQTVWQFTEEDGNLRNPRSHKSPIPVSIKMMTGEAVLTRLVLEQLVGHMQHRIANYDVADYSTHLYRRDGLHPYTDQDGDFRARIADIAPTGHLVLEDTDGRLRRYAFKEVVFG